MTTPSANAPTITIKVSTKKKEGDNPFYTEVGAGWVKTGKHGQYISVSLHPNVSISQGVVMTNQKTTSFR